MVQTIIQTLRRSLTEYDVADIDRPTVVMLTTRTFDKLEKELTGEIAVGREHLKGCRHNVELREVTIDGVLFTDEDA